MYHLIIHEDTPDIHAGPIKEELKITTHYENLDIAQSRRIHYICFALPENPLPDSDDLLMERIKTEEPTPPARPVRPRASIKGKNAPTHETKSPTTHERAD
jgi:hypothetical protein